MLPSSGVFNFGKNSGHQRPTRLPVEESLVACSKGHRLDASDTPLKNASIVVTHVSAQGLCEEKLRISLVSEEKVCKSPNLDTGGRARSIARNLGAHAMMQKTGYRSELSDSLRCRQSFAC